MTIEFSPLSSFLGAEVREFDPLRASYEPTEVAALQEALRTWKVLVFRGFDMDIEDQIRVCEAAAAAKLSYRGGIIYADATDRATYVSNVHKDGLFGTGELSFHSDLSFTPHILKARSLYSLVLPSSSESGGETLFSDVTQACADLDPALRDRAQGLVARFEAIYPYKDGAVVLDFVRPLIDLHPDTGRAFIAASRAVTKEVSGMERSEFRPLLKELWAHIEKPQYVYRHRWRLNELVLWDNIAVQHARTPFDPRERRSLRAVSLDAPHIAVTQSYQQPLTASSTAATPGP